MLVLICFLESLDSFLEIIVFGDEFYTTSEASEAVEAVVSKDDSKGNEQNSDESKPGEIDSQGKVLILISYLIS